MRWAPALFLPAPFSHSLIRSVHTQTGPASTSPLSIAEGRLIYARKNQTERAVQFLNAAIGMRPDYADAFSNLGVLFVQAQRYPEAKEKFKACIERAPDFDQAYLNLARLYLVLKEQAKARSVLQALLQRQPQHKMAEQMLQMLY